MPYDQIWSIYIKKPVGFKVGPDIELSQVTFSKLLAKNSDKRGNCEAKTKK